MKHIPQKIGNFKNIRDSKEFKITTATGILYSICRIRQAIFNGILNLALKDSKNIFIS